jgi:hypothetical protein
MPEMPQQEMMPEQPEMMMPEEEMMPPQGMPQ